MISCAAPAADEGLGGGHNLNSGDWVENRMAIVEHLDLRMEVIFRNQSWRLVGATPTRRISGVPSVPMAMNS